MIGSGFVCVLTSGKSVAFHLVRKSLDTELWCVKWSANYFYEENGLFDYYQMIDLSSSTKIIWYGLHYSTF